MHEKIIVSYIATLSAIEIGLGAFLHGLKIPFSGHSLSLNQIFILTRATIDSQYKSAGKDISTVCALLKSLSPAGKKLTPMLAIAAQGHLFSLGTYLLGNNILGYIFGAILLGLWAFIQPICIYLLLFGKDFYYMLNYFIDKLNKVLPTNIDNIFDILIPLVIIKVSLSITVAIIAYKISPVQLNLYKKWAISFTPKKKKKIESNIFHGAFKDLFNPAFLFSYILLIIFFFFSYSDLSKTIWLLLRPLTIGYIFFLIVRAFPQSKLAKLLGNTKFGQYVKVYDSEYSNKDK